MRVRPTGDVAGGKNSRRARLEISVHLDAAVDRKTGLFGELHARAHADAHDHKLGIDAGAAFQLDLARSDFACRVLEVEDHPVLFVERADEIAHLPSQDALHRPLLGCDDMDFDAPGAQRSCYFKPDEARTQNHRAPRASRLRNDCPAIGKRAQCMDVRQLRAGKGKPDRRRAGREQKAVIGDGAAATQGDLVRAWIDPYHLRIQAQIDSIVGVVARRAQRHPIFRRTARQIILREVRAIDGRRIVVAEHGDAALVVEAAEHLGRGKPCCSAADDDDLIRLSAAPRSARFRLGRRPLLAREDFPLALFDLPAFDRRERGRAQRLTRAQIETGVMPRTTNGVADDETVCKRPMVVRAMRAHGEDFRSSAHEENVLIADLSHEHAAIWEHARIDALG